MRYEDFEGRFPCVRVDRDLLWRWTSESQVIFCHAQHYYFNFWYSSDCYSSRFFSAVSNSVGNLRNTFLPNTTIWWFSHLLPLHTICTNSTILPVAYFNLKVRFGCSVAEAIRLSRKVSSYGGVSRSSALGLREIQFAWEIELLKPPLRIFNGVWNVPRFGWGCDWPLSPESSESRRFDDIMSEVAFFGHRPLVRNFSSNELFFTSGLLILTAARFKFLLLRSFPLMSILGSILCYLLFSHGFFFRAVSDFWVSNNR